MTQFKKHKLYTLCTKIGSGSTPRGGDAVYKSEGISLIRSQNVLDFTFSTNGLAFIDEKQAKELINVTLKERDVLLNITGDSVARVSQVPDNILPARVNQHVAIIRANQQKLNPEFLKYSLLSKPNKEMLLSLASTGATRKAITKAMIEDFEIEIPDEEGTVTQTLIASILSSLDDKIELNRRTNQTLEQMAQTLFKKYFVDDIDPENLPEGWKVGKLGDVVDITSSKRIFLNEYVSSGIPFFRGKEIIELHKGGIVSNELFISNKKFEEIKSKFGIPKKGDILITSVGTIGVPYLIPDHKPFYFKDGNLTWVRSYFGYIDSYFLYQWLISDEGQYSIKNITIGSTQQAITIQGLKNLNIIIPTKTLVESISKQLMAIREKISNNMDEVISLTKLRDSLLTKLMSGEIEVKG